MDESNSVTFRAIIVPGTAGMKIGDDGARVTFEVAESELMEMLPIVAFRHDVVLVSVSVDAETCRTGADDGRENADERRQLHI